MSLIEQHPLPPTLCAMQRLLSQPVNYTGEAAGVRYKTNRQLRGLAKWHHQRNGRNFPETTAAAAPQPRVHPDRPRTFCLPDGWTSEGIWTADLARLHAATSASASPAARRRQLAPSLPPQLPPPRQREKKASLTPETAFFQERSVTLFGDEFQPRPQPPNLPVPALTPPHPQPQQPPFLSATSAVAASASAAAPAAAASAWWVAVDPTYFVLERRCERDNAEQRRNSAATLSVSVSAKRLQASGGLVAHVGRNGRPVLSAPAPAAAADPATGAQTRRPAKLCWDAELADPAVIIIEASRPGAREAEQAAAAAAALEEQRRSRRVVIFDHGAAGTNKETAAVLERLRAQPSSARRQPQPLLAPRSLSVADSAAVAPITDAVDRLRRSKTETEVAANATAPKKVPAAATAISSTAVSKTAASPAVVETAPTGRHNAVRRPPQLPSTKKPLVTRPFAAATFSPRYEADASLVISTLTAATATDTTATAAATAAAADAAAASAGGVGRISAGRRSLASPWRFPPMGPSPLALPKGGGGDYLTFVRSLPGQKPQLMWPTTVGSGAAMSRSSEQHQRQSLASAPMPSTPRIGEELELEVADEAAADEEATISANAIAGAEAGVEAAAKAASKAEAGLAAAAAAMKSPSLVSTVSLTSTRNSELLISSSAASVQIPTGGSRRDPLSSSGGSDIGANDDDEASGKD